MRIIETYPPGGASDVLARVLAQGLAEQLGQPFLVENRSGGGGHIGADAVAKSPPNGYTLLVAGVPHAIGMTLYRKLPYDMATDLEPVARIATFGSLIVVHPSLPVASVPELLEHAKARPGAINYGANPGSQNHLAIELLNTMGKVKMVHIGYKGAAPVVQDLLAGQLHLASLGIPSVLPHVQSGRLRAIAVTGARRSPLLPDLRTVAESGLPGYDVTAWYGLYAPAGTPGQIVARLHAEIRKVLQSASVAARMAGLGAEAAPTSPQELGRITRDEIRKWAQVIQDAGVRLE